MTANGECKLKRVIPGMSITRPYVIVAVLVPGIPTPRPVSVGEWRADTEPLLHGQLQRTEQWFIRARLPRRHVQLATWSA